MSAKAAATGGLALVDKYYADYGSRARELKKQGRKIIGYVCSYVPVEIITAARLVPFRIKGDVNEPITRADAKMETIVCPLVRSCFDMTLKDHYDFMDGLVMPHACDSYVRTYDVWKYTLGLNYNHFINTPHSTYDSSVQFFKAVLNTFRKSLGGFVKSEISDDSLRKAIRSYNEDRVNARELYELRKLEPPLISGTEVTKVLVAGTSIPVEESAKLISSVIDEAKQRGRLPAKASARIMVVGAEVDDVAFIKLIEDTGAQVVCDDLCPGTRQNFPLVDITDDPLDGLAERYLRKIKCARTYREQKGTYPEYLEDRFGHIRQFINDFKVDGVILYIYKYCDPFGFEVPAMKGYIESLGTPVLYIEDEYSMSTIGRLRTRIQAFLELLSAR